MNTTCLQCGSILPLGVRVCTFCDSHLSDADASSFSAPQSGANPSPNQPADSVWRGELANRVASYRARRRRNSPADSQPQLPFEQYAVAALVSPTVSAAVAEPPAPGTPPNDDFSFTIAIGRNASRPCDDGQMFIDVSVPPAQTGTPESVSDPPESAATQHSGLYPVASIDERRIAGLIDAACLLFPWGGFLALLGSLTGHFAFSKLSATIYFASFALVYVQYFALFTVFGGTTPGMMLRGLRVVDFSGEEPSPRQFLLRAAGYMLSAGTFFLGFLWSQWDEDELTWHDRISRTYLSSAPSIADSEFTGVAHTH